MRLGVITDIHNNFIALERVLDSLYKEKCDKIICCGDIIGIGPYPEETVQLMMKTENLIAVRGNHERYLLEGIDSNLEEMDENEKNLHLWEHNMLTESSKAFLESLPYRIDMVIEGKRISVMHYPMDSKNRYVNFKLFPNENDLKKIFKDVNSDIILYGHNHFKNICKSQKLYINAGSLGCPSNDKNIARFGILEITENNVSFLPKKIAYNSQIVIDKINEYNYPDGDKIKKIFYGID
ncbi:MAG: YfcE family phosphodiesterase [Eubacteriales bacterium]|nr:YfcE family phosphodiesterase [Eubacteriales bacterium]